MSSHGWYDHASIKVMACYSNVQGRIKPKQLAERKRSADRSVARYMDQQTDRYHI